MLQINERTLFNVVRPGWLDTDLIRFKTAGVVIKQESVPLVEGRRILPGGSPVGVDPEDTGKFIPARRAWLVLEGGSLAAPWRFLVRAASTGVAGNSITVSLVAPQGNNQELAVSVVGNAITVSLATGGTGQVTSTCEDVVEALNASEAAMALLSEAEVVTGADVVVSSSGGAKNLANGVNAQFLTLADVDVTYGDNTVAVLDQGRVVAGGLPLSVDGLPVVDAGVRAQLPGITFIE